MTSRLRVRHRYDHSLPIGQVVAPTKYDDQVRVRWGTNDHSTLEWKDELIVLNSTKTAAA